MDTKTALQLSPAEKLQLIEELWDSLAANPEDVPIYEWQKAEIDRRLEYLERHPETGRSWEQVKSEIVRRRHG